MGGNPPMIGPLSVTVWAFFQAPAKPTRKRREAIERGIDWHMCRPDGDNVLKAVSDALNGIVWRDDAQIAQATIIKLYDFRPRVLVEIRPMLAGATR